MGNAEDMVDPTLSEDERTVLNRGLVEWGGPAHCTERLAIAMGFRGVDNLLEDGYRIADEIDAGRALSRRDWTRALLATEIVFASDIVGSGHDWQVTTGLNDGHTLRILRGLQLKLAAVVVGRGAWE